MNQSTITLEYGERYGHAYGPRPGQDEERAEVPRWLYLWIFKAARAGFEVQQGAREVHPALVTRHLRRQCCYAAFRQGFAMRQPNKYPPSAEEMLIQYKRNAMAAHKLKDYTARNKWCQKHDALALMLIAGDNPFERQAA